LFGLFWLQDQGKPLGAVYAAAHVVEKASKKENLQTGIKEGLNTL